MSVWKDESGYYENYLHPIMTIPLEGSSLGTAQKHTNNPRSIGLFHPERDEVYLLCPDEDQFQLVRERERERESFGAWFRRDNATLQTPFS